MRKQAPAKNAINLSQVISNMPEVKPLILIVEDDEDTRFLLSFLMKQSGFRVVQAFDGAEAIKIAVRRLPDLILMDTSLPRVDGLTATRGIRKVARLSSVPIIFVSGHAQPEARTAALATGGNEYFVKPINLNDLEIAVKKQLASCDSLRADPLQRSYQQQIVAASKELRRALKT
jgi:two-component system cell cycle response regulator DivK